MSTLHTIARSPRSELLTSCLQLVGNKDTLLFIEDGVYYCLAPEQLAKVPDGCEVFALREDVVARGLQSNNPAGLEAITTRSFVDLCCRHDKVVNWF